MWSSILMLITNIVNIFTSFIKRSDDHYDKNKEARFQEVFDEQKKMIEKSHKTNDLEDIRKELGR